MEYRIEDLTKEEADYIGEKINEIVPCEVDADEEKFVLKIDITNTTGRECCLTTFGLMSAIAITESVL